MSHSPDNAQHLGSNQHADKAVVHGRLLSGWRGLIRVQGGQILLLITALLCLTYSICTPLPPKVETSDHFDDAQPPEGLPPAQLHLLIPASRPDPNLCKLLLSAGILGYPTPTILNWQQEFNDNGLVEGGSHLAKITGVHDYLIALDETHDEDLVLMVDGYDIWLQLRPQTLLERYFALNRQADARIQAEMGLAAAGIKQQIIFGCQKRCWPWNPEDPPCYAVPNSTLLGDVYGTRTDMLASEDGPFGPFVNFRPRFLNSGTGVGTVRAMRKLFAQALQLAEREPNIGSDQYIFSHIFGDQEVWREVARRDAVAHREELEVDLMGTGLEHKHFFSLQHLEEVRQKAAETADGNYEFGIGVDYGAEIVLNTVFAEADTEWLMFSNETQLLQARENHNLDKIDRGALRLANDITNSLAHFAAEGDGSREESTVEWQDVSLLTDVFTGNSPAVIHHNAHREGLKSRRESWWPLVWYQKDARELYQAQTAVSIKPAATGGYDGQARREWWSPELRKGGARDGRVKTMQNGEGWLDFGDICRAYDQEIFRHDREA